MYSLRYVDPITWEQVEGVYAGCPGVSISHPHPMNGSVHHNKHKTTRSRRTCQLCDPMEIKYATWTGNTETGP